LLKTELEISDPAPHQKAKASTKKDRLQKVVDLVDSAGPAEEVALPSKIVDLLNTEPEITYSKPNREAKAAPKNASDNDVDPLDLADTVEQMKSLRNTIAMLKAGLEIRNEQLNVLSEQLELCREEVRKMRPLLSGQLELCSHGVQQLRSLLGSIQASEQDLEAEPREPSAAGPEAAVEKPVNDQTFVAADESTAPEIPTRVTNLNFARSSD
jgi:chromosome segregation ATPase